MTNSALHQQEPAHAAWTHTHCVARMLRCGFFGAGPVTLARAPGRLDIMGGIADYSGAMVCEMPLDVAAVAGVQRRRDDQVCCASRQIDGKAAVSVTDLQAMADPRALRAALAPPGHWARYILGCAWWLGHRRGAWAPLSILVDSDVPLGGGVSSSAAIEVATMTALASMLGVAMSPLQVAVACQEVENHVVGAPCGVMDQVTASLGQQGRLMNILCQPGPDGAPAQILGHLSMPPGYRFLGLFSGVRHEVSGDPYTDTRVAAFMGQRILAGLESSDITDGYLARLSSTDYLKRWRNRLPKHIRGLEFLARYGQTRDPVTTIVPDRIYHVRGATDHHVREASRVRRFVARLADAAREEASLDAMVRAGALMGRSHWSYSENARLGHPMTDRLVGMVQAAGPEAGLLGAKITGGGCGGTVAVLCQDHDQARASIASVRDAYTRETGRQTLLLDGSSPGAAASGTVTLNCEPRP